MFGTQTWREWANQGRAPRNPKQLGAIAWWDAHLSVIGTTGGLIDTITDVTGVTGTATGSGATRPTLSATGWNGTPCIDFGATGNLGLTTPSMTIGVHSIFVVLQGNASSRYVITQVNDGTNGYVYGQNNASSRVGRGGNNSDRQVSATWLSDGVKHTAMRTFGGTHATHILYRDGVNQNATDGGATADPGTGTVSGAWYLGTNQSFSAGFGLRGLAILWAVFPTALTALEAYELDRYARGRGLL